MNKTNNNSVANAVGVKRKSTNQSSFYT